MISFLHLEQVVLSSLLHISISAPQEGHSYSSGITGPLRSAPGHSCFSIIHPPAATVCISTRLFSFTAIYIHLVSSVEGPVSRGEWGGMRGRSARCGCEGRFEHKVTKGTKVG